MRKLIYVPMVHDPWSEYDKRMVDGVLVSNQGKTVINTIRGRNQ
jgi:hypothetical protein